MGCCADPDTLATKPPVDAVRQPDDIPWVAAVSAAARDSAVVTVVVAGGHDTARASGSRLFPATAVRSQPGSFTGSDPTPCRRSRRPRKSGWVSRRGVERTGMPEGSMPDGGAPDAAGAGALLPAGAPPPAASRSPSGRRAPTSVPRRNTATARPASQADLGIGNTPPPRLLGDRPRRPPGAGPPVPTPAPCPRTGAGCRHAAGARAAP